MASGGKTPKRKRKPVSQQLSAGNTNVPPPNIKKVKQTFTCSCSRRCKGIVKQLTRATYLKHAAFREIDEQKESQAQVDEAINLPQLDGNALLREGIRTAEVFESISSVFYLSYLSTFIT